MAVGGVYAILGVGKRIYIGQSVNILKRPTIDLARRLGLSWTILKSAPNSTRIEREFMEAKAHDDYRAAGFEVVSLDRPEVTRRAQANIDVEVRSQRIRDSWDSHPERRVAQANRVRLINAARTPESRIAAVRKGWETRRNQPKILRGSSSRTNQRRRAALARGISQ